MGTNKPNEDEERHGCREGGGKSEAGGPQPESDKWISDRIESACEAFLRARDELRIVGIKLDAINCESGKDLPVVRLSICKLPYT